MNSEQQTFPPFIRVHLSKIENGQEVKKQLYLKLEEKKFITIERTISYYMEYMYDPDKGLVLVNEYEAFDIMCGNDFNVLSENDYYLNVVQNSIDAYRMKLEKAQKEYKHIMVNSVTFLQSKGFEINGSELVRILEK